MVDYATDKHTVEIKDQPAKYHVRGRLKRYTGYGQKIPTDTVIRLDGRGPWRRVYATVISNASNYWITLKGKKLFLHDLATTSAPSLAQNT